MGSAMQVESFVQDALSKVLSHLLLWDKINFLGLTSESVESPFSFSQGRNKSSAYDNNW